MTARNDCLDFRCSASLLDLQAVQQEVAAQTCTFFCFFTGRWGWPPRLPAFPARFALLPLPAFRLLPAATLLTFPVFMGMRTAAHMARNRPCKVFFTLGKP